MRLPKISTLRFLPAIITFIGSFCLILFLERGPAGKSDLPTAESERDESEHHDEDRSETSKSRKPEDDASDAFRWWYEQRALPFPEIPQGAFQKAFRKYRLAFEKNKKHSAAISATEQWYSLGPDNVAGRILSLAVDPTSPNVVWAGASGGGLWQTTTQGIGANAWTFINTGFPTVSVGAIAIDPVDHNTIYIGTGELSFYQRPLVGLVGARSSYGMGILKTTDGGATWDTTSLSYPFSATTAIDKIVINPQNHNTIFTATSEGTFKSTNAGTTWTLSDSTLMAIDVVMNPLDTTVLYLTCGNYNQSPNPGLYKTTDAGGSWDQLTTGLPSADFGRTPLAMSISDTSIVYAGIANASTLGDYGLYQTTNAGSSWSAVSTVNYVGSQGWFDNTIAVSPIDANSVYCAGLDIYKSTNGGSNLAEQTYWYAGYTFVVPPGGPEGPTNYSHADDHAIAIDPTNPETIYFGNDGGVFQSTDGGATFYGRNGGLMTTEYYPGLAVVPTDSTKMLGGLQDNGVLLYSNSPVWSKVDGGDGGFCAIDPTNPNIMFDEYVYLAISKSTDGGRSFSGATDGLPNGSSSANFIAPFVMSPTNPSILYAGATAVYKSTNEGDSWFTPSGSSNLNGTTISAIGVSWTNPDTLMAATGTGVFGVTPTFQVFSSTNGGVTWNNVTDTLPDRYPTHIAFDPENSATACITFSGYGSSHVFRTTNLGQTWTDISSNLPDIPTQACVIDFDDTNSIYIGTDLGVFYSTNGGAEWEEFNDGMPPTMVMDLVISPANYALRAATFGHGIFERHIPVHPYLTLLSPNGGQQWTGGDVDSIKWTQKNVNTLSIQFSLDSGLTWDYVTTSYSAASGFYLWQVPTTLSNNVFIRITDLAADTVIAVSQSPFSIIAAEDIRTGWNLLSLNQRVANGAVTAVFPEAVTSAFFYQGKYIQSDSIYPGVGFWLKFAASNNFTFSGDSIYADTISVNKGWNIIGGISFPVADSNIVQNPPLNITSLTYGYNPQFGYYSVDTLQPKRGYWVKVQSDGTLAFSVSGSSALQKASATTILPDPVNSFTLRDAAGRSRTLYLTDQLHGTNLQLFDLPPVPPLEGFDIRFTSQRSLECISADSETFPIAMQSVVYPLTLEWDAVEGSPDIFLKENGKFARALSGSGQITIDQAAGFNIAFGTRRNIPGASPKTFLLEQNYPNPFNPSTNIRYEIPSQSFVTVAVVDLLGKEVALLVNEKQNAGSYTAHFNAGQLPSGMYFVRMRAGAFESVKKMLVIK
jgi:photosystem II stability/assembly factor-like uncharacterized protein